MELCLSSGRDGSTTCWRRRAAAAGLPDTTTTVVVGGGGLPTTASHIITINRTGVAEPITVDLGTDPAKSAAANIPIFPRDTIIVPRVGVVYLLGAFKTPGRDTASTKLADDADEGGRAYGRRWL